METMVIFILALGLAMDCFAISISNSSLAGEVKPGSPLKTAIAFAFAHMVLLFLGHWLGGAIQSMFANIETMIAFIILVIIGSKMIMEAVKRHPKSKVFDINQAKVIVVLSLATSMDAFLVGLALGITSMTIVLSGILITITVFILTLAGMAGGQQFGIGFTKRVTMFGGIFLLLAALHFLLRFLGAF
ncbi:MAG: manganese efflux pump [Bacteroidales bacterium]